MWNIYCMQYCNVLNTVNFISTFIINNENGHINFMVLLLFILLLSFLLSIYILALSLKTNSIRSSGSLSISQPFSIVHCLWIILLLFWMMFVCYFLEYSRKMKKLHHIEKHSCGSFVKFPCFQTFLWKWYNWYKLLAD